MSFIVLETSLEELKFDFPHTLREILINEVLAHLEGICKLQGGCCKKMSRHYYKMWVQFSSPHSLN
jgi:hypothetical protein